MGGLCAICLSMVTLNQGSYTYIYIYICVVVFYDEESICFEAAHHEVECKSMPCQIGPGFLVCSLDHKLALGGCRYIMTFAQSMSN